MNQQTWTLRFTAGEPYLAGDPAALARRRVRGHDASSPSCSPASPPRRCRAGGPGSAPSISSRSLRESEARWRTHLRARPGGHLHGGRRGPFPPGEPALLRDHRLHAGRAGPDAPARTSSTRTTGPATRAVARKVRDREIEVGTLERRGLRKDGTTFWAEVTYSLEPAATGDPRRDDRGPRGRHRPSRGRGQVPRDRRALAGRDPHRPGRDGSPTPTRWWPSWPGRPPGSSWARRADWAARADPPRRPPDGARRGGRGRSRRWPERSAPSPTGS